MAKKTGLTSKLLPAAAIGAGAVAAGFVSSKIPVENDKLKAAAPLALGIFLMTRKGIVADLGAGMVAGGALKLAQSGYLIIIVCVQWADLMICKTRNLSLA